MQEIVLTKGIPASGKSTWAKKMVSQSDDWKRVNKDDLREMLDCSQWSSSNEAFILNIRDHIVSESIRKGKNVIVDDTNFESKHFLKMCEIAKSFNKDIMVRELYFPITLEEALKRNSTRERVVPEQVIRQFYNKYKSGLAITERCRIFNEVSLTTLEEEEENLPEAIICDLDGTLALIGDRSPYDASRSEHDYINTPVAEVIRRMKEAGKKIIFVSGREDKDREPTERFIHNHLDDYRLKFIPHGHEFVPGEEIHDLIPFEYELYMRRTKDMRRDTVVKREIYDKHIKGRYKVLFVIDDRPSVVRMWRHDLGFTVFQLNDKEF